MPYSDLNGVSMTDERLSVVYEFSGFRLNPAERLLEQNGRAVPLTRKPSIFSCISSNGEAGWWRSTPS